MADAAFVKEESEEKIIPASIDDEDLDEDAGDLEFFDPNAPDGRFQNLYLARIPRYMWEAWQKLADRLGDDDEIQIGTLRTWNEPQADTSLPPVTKLRMLLHPNCPEHQRLPREYRLDVLDQNVANHFIFTEEHLAGYKAKNKERQEALDAGIPSYALRPKAPQQQGQGQQGQGGPERQTYDRKSRFQPYYRKAIPKRTKIFGKIHYDVRVEPCNPKEEEEFLARQMFDAEHTRGNLRIISKQEAAMIDNKSMVPVADGRNGFIRNAAPIKPKKSEYLKAARMPKDQLLDLIFACFRDYKYYSVKALRQRVHQPESYLRQVLEEIAVLHKSGPFANKYSLTEAYVDKSGTAAQETAAVEAEDDAEDEDEDMEEMEDVIPSTTS